MRKWITAIAIAASTMTAAHAAVSNFMGGAKLSLLALAHDRVIALDKSMSTDDLYNANRFSGYVLGATDALTTAGVLCPVDGVTELQLDALVSKYLKDHPDQWAMSGPSIVYSALQPLLGCRK